MCTIYLKKRLAHVDSDSPSTVVTLTHTQLHIHPHIPHPRANFYRLTKYWWFGGPSGDDNNHRLEEGFWHLFVPRPPPWLSHVPKCYTTTELHFIRPLLNSIPTSFSQRVQRRNLKENVYGVLGAFTPMQRANNAGKFALVNLQRMFRNFALLNKSWCLHTYCEWVVYSRSNRLPVEFLIEKY